MTAGRPCPEAPAPPPLPRAGTDPYFARVHVLSLRRTPERLADFWRRFPADWPYRRPEVFEAVDGQSVALPPAWEDWPNFADGGKRGAYGCHQSWLALVRRLIAEGVSGPVLVFEDDAQLAPDALARLPDYLRSLPDDWDIAYLGCQHLRQPEPVAPGLVRCAGAERTHALAVHPRFFRALEIAWTDWTRHVDWRLRDLAPKCRFYAPDPPLAGQAASHSVIMSRPEGYRDWALPKTDEQRFREKLAARERADWPAVPPAVFYHVACMNGDRPGGWRDVVREQCRLLAHVGLTDVTSAVLGARADAGEAVRVAESCGVRLAVAFHDESIPLCELPTLNLIHAWARAQTGPAPALYLHTKGVSAPGDPTKAHWRRLMQKHVVADWRANVARLQACDHVGVDWEDMPDYPHYCGNFWMARSDWLAGLDPPEQYRHSRPDFHWAGQSWRGRMFAETWLGSKPWHHIESLCCRNERLWEWPVVSRHNISVDGFDYEDD